MVAVRAPKEPRRTTFPMTDGSLLSVLVQKR